MKDLDLPKTSPMPGVPRVRYADAAGNVVEGWYAFHEKRQPCPMNDELAPDDCLHLIVSDSFADWNMPVDLRIVAIDPDGGDIELVGGPDAAALAEAARSLEALADRIGGGPVAGRIDERLSAIAASIRDALRPQAASSLQCEEERRRMARALRNIRPVTLQGRELCDGEDVALALVLDCPGSALCTRESVLRLADALDPQGEAQQEGAGR